MKYLLPPPPVASVPITGSDARFPVRRVYCVGRNYAEHALEMGSDPRREEPFFFCKPADGVVAAQDGPVTVPYPPRTSHLHHEVELVVAIGAGGQDIPVQDATTHVFGYAIGLDMTRRDLQLAMRRAGRPWEVGKTFECCAPIGPIHPLTEAGEISAGAIELAVDGEVRQRDDVGRMIWSVGEIIGALSRYFLLRPGDLVFTGTPAGVGPVQVGEQLVARIERLGELRVVVGPAGATTVNAT